MPDRLAAHPQVARRALAWMTAAAAARDLCMIALGVLAVLGPEPPSLYDLGLGGPAATIWGAGFLVGGALSLVGSSLRSRGDVVQATGCGIVGGAFGIWAWGAVAQPAATTVSWMVALVLLAGVAGQVFRVAYIATGAGRLIRYMLAAYARGEVPVCMHLPDERPGRPGQPGRAGRAGRP